MDEQTKKDDGFKKDADMLNGMLLDAFMNGWPAHDLAVAVGLLEDPQACVMIHRSNAAKMLRERGDIEQAEQLEGEGRAGHAPVVYFFDDDASFAIWHPVPMDAVRAKGGAA